MKFSTLVLFTLLSVIAIGQSTVSSVPNPKSSTTNGYVSNPDGILSPDDVGIIDNICAEIEANDSFQVAFAILNSIGSEVPKDFAGRLFNQWGVGHAGRDDGLLVLFVMDQRRIEFETGYGTEQVLTDYQCVQLQQEHMIPHFKNEDYATGLILGAKALQESLSGKIVDRNNMHLHIERNIEPVKVSVQSINEDDQLIRLRQIAISSEAVYISVIERRNDIALELIGQIEDRSTRNELKESITDYDFDKIRSSEQRFRLALSDVLSEMEINEEMKVRLQGGENRISSERSRYQAAVSSYNSTLESSDPEGDFEPIEAKN